MDEGMMLINRMEFLMDCRPQATWDLYREDKKALYDQIAKRVDLALEYQLKLMKKDLGRDQIQELVSNLVYPRDVEEQPAPKGMPWEKMVEWAERKALTITI